jgi:hypothetical protein
VRKSGKKPTFGKRIPTSARSGDDQDKQDTLKKEKNTMAIARATGGFLAVLKELLNRVSRIASADVRERFVVALRKALEILEVHAVQENAISVDTSLSQTGQEAKIVALAKDTLQKLRWLLVMADDAGAAYTRLEALLLAVPDAPKAVNELIQFFRESEIRTWLRSMTAPERMGKYALAVQQDDADTIRAFRLAPGEPLIPHDIQDRFDRERLEVTKPNELVRLQSLEILRDELQALAKLLFSWLEGYGAKFEAKFEDKTTLRSGQYLVGFGDSVTFPVPKIKPANFR